MGIYARNLHRGVSTQPQSAARQLVDQLEGLQIEGWIAVRQQRVQVLQHRRHDQFVPASPGVIKPDAAQFLNVASLRGQHISDVIR
jgi:hypothetical protein